MSSHSESFAAALPCRSLQDQSRSGHFTDPNYDAVATCASTTRKYEPARKVESAIMGRTWSVGPSYAYQDVLPAAQNSWPITPTSSTKQGAARGPRSEKGLAFMGPARG